VKSTLLKAYSSLSSKYGSKKPTVVVTGHSLGGAVAILLAVDVYKAGGKNL
jgi:putative lipase involved disintegration of autophagic bodies